MKWIKCGDRLPKFGERVLIYSERFGAETAKLVKNHFDNINFDAGRTFGVSIGDEATHWCLIELPEEE